MPKFVANKGYGAREITDLILFLLISLFPLEIVLEDADTFLMPQGYVKLNIPNLSLSRLQCKGNNSIISCQELRCITVNSFICCKVIQQYSKHYSYQNLNQSFVSQSTCSVIVINICIIINSTKKIS